MPSPFKRPPAQPDLPAIEERVLGFWEENQIFEKLRAKNRGGPRHSFIDGPITANNPMGVHHAWGRTYKDVYTRYRAMRGFRPALPERIRLPGPVGRGRGRTGPGVEFQARNRGVRSRQFLARLRRPGSPVRAADHRSVQAAGHVDGLVRFVLHAFGQQHRAHLAFPQDLQRERLAAARPPGHAVVHALRDLALPARAARHRHLPGADPHRRYAAPAAGGKARRPPAGVDDHALDAGRKRGLRGLPGP